MTYFDELKKSMEYLGSKKDTLFLGQAVEVPGTAMFNTIKGIAKALNDLVVRICKWYDMINELVLLLLFFLGGIFYYTVLIN